MIGKYNFENNLIHYSTQETAIKGTIAIANKSRQVIYLSSDDLFNLVKNSEEAKLRDTVFAATRAWLTAFWVISCTFYEQKTDFLNTIKPNFSDALAEMIDRVKTGAIDVLEMSEIPRSPEKQAESALHKTSKRKKSQNQDSFAYLFAPLLKETENNKKEQIVAVPQLQEQQDATIVELKKVEEQIPISHSGGENKETEARAQDESIVAVPQLQKEQDLILAKAKIAEEEQLPINLSGEEEKLNSDKKIIVSDSKERTETIFDSLKKLRSNRQIQILSASLLTMGALYSFKLLSCMQEQEDSSTLMLECHEQITADGMKHTIAAIASLTGLTLGISAWK